MESELDKFSQSVDGQRYMDPEVFTREGDEFIQNLRNTQAQHNAEIRQQTENLGTFPASQSNLGGLGGGEATFINNYQTAPTNNIVANLKAAADAQALNQALQNELEYKKNEYSKILAAKRARDAAAAAAAQTPVAGGVDISASTDEDELNTNENAVKIPKAETTDIGAVANANAYAGVTGQGQMPTSSSVAGILVDKDGNRTAIRVHPGQGIDVAGGMSYTKEGARNFLSDWVKNGGQVLNYLGRGGYSTNMISWDLY